MEVQGKILFCHQTLHVFIISINILFEIFGLDFMFMNIYCKQSYLTENNTPLIIPLLRKDNFFWFLESRILGLEEKGFSFFLFFFYKDDMVLFLGSIYF